MEKIKHLETKYKILISVLVVLVVLIIGSITFYFNGISSVSSDSQKVIVTIPENSSGNKVLDILDERGLINSKLASKIYLKLNSYSFKSNSYVLNRNMSLEEMLDIIENPTAKYICNTRITVIDGTTIPDYAKVIAKNTDLKENDILKKWNDETYLKKLIKEYWFLDDSILNKDVYFALEGYLAPNTYILTKQQENIETITKMMLDQTEKTLKPYKKDIQKFTINGKKLTTHEFVTLASVIQRESPTNNKDSKLIAGVLIHRLEKNMMLQCDVTVNYANQVTKVAVTHKDLQVDSKYNTYKNAGLPIGPISSLSDRIIDNLLNYTKTDNLYFFATKDGDILFSKTYEEHQKKVADNKWY